MTFSNSTSDADPGAGKIAFNNGTLSSVSVLFVDDADDASADITSFVQSWDDVSNAEARGIVTVTKEGTPSTYATFKVSGAVTDASGYTKVPVTHVVSAGSFSNLDGVGVHFSYSGADGSGNVTTDGTQTLTNKTLTSPKIGTSILDTNGNELFKLTATSSAVNEITYNNAATGNKPTFTASGGDTNIGVSIQPKGSGQVTIDNLTFPAADGSADQFLKTDGSGNLSFATASGGIDWQSSIKTSNFTASAGEGYFVNTTSGAVTMTLPAGSAGAVVAVKDYAKTFDSNALTIAANGSEKIGGGTDNAILSVEGKAIELVYGDATQGWQVVADGLQSSAPQNYSADFLVIAGGGGGDNDDAGGGGAGGYRTSTQDIIPGVQYTVTVGDGGAASANGSDSSISGSGITTITSAGGGEGGTPGNAGNDGGSGGGGGSNSSGSGGAGGSGNTPSTSPSQGNNGGAGSSSPRTAGGGGGAGEAGNTDGLGHGGDGSSSSITGSAVTRAGGGGGSTRVDGTRRPGGDGGGGAGGTDSPANTAVNGTANTGGGGGGGPGSDPKTGGSGGKGVVIISVPTANYSGTTTGSPDVTTSGSNTILQFNGSGSYTAQEIIWLVLQKQD